MAKEEKWVAIAPKPSVTAFVRNRPVAMTLVYLAIFVSLGLGTEIFVNIPFLWPVVIAGMSAVTAIAVAYFAVTPRRFKLVPKTMIDMWDAKIKRANIKSTRRARRWLAKQHLEELSDSTSTGMDRRLDSLVWNYKRSLKKSALNS